MKSWPVLNKYEIMWMMVLFDLPVVEKKERKEATEFRNFLLDNGFAMVQYSIYVRVFSGSDACSKYFRLIEEHLPNKGKVDILTITDRQYETIKSYSNNSQSSRKKHHGQLLMF
jgi:CRISPR-associated protein Cas2